MSGCAFLGTITSSVVKTQCKIRGSSSTGAVFSSLASSSADHISFLESSSLYRTDLFIRHLQQAAPPFLLTLVPPHLLLPVKVEGIINWLHLESPERDPDIQLQGITATQRASLHLAQCVNETPRPRQFIQRKH